MRFAACGLRWSVPTSKNINARLPVTDLFPYGDNTVRLQTESSGLVRWQAFRIRPTVNFKKFSMSGLYSLAFLTNDFESPAADPYNLFVPAADLAVHLTFLLERGWRPLRLG